MLEVELTERWLSGLVLRVNGEMVPMELEVELDR